MHAIEKDNEKSKPKPATMKIPSNEMYATADNNKTKNYYRVLAEDKPADADGECDVHGYTSVPQV